MLDSYEQDSEGGVALQGRLSGYNWTDHARQWLKGEASDGREEVELKDVSSPPTP